MTQTVTQRSTRQNQAESWLYVFVIVAAISAVLGFIATGMLTDLGATAGLIGAAFTALPWLPVIAYFDCLRRTAKG